MLCGVDEAGRGPVIGPMVVAAVMVEDDGPLREMKVRDSKKLTVKKREELAPQIRKVARYKLTVVEAEDIDSRRDDMSLNAFEAELFAGLIERLRPDEVFIDACDTNERRFGRTVQSHLSYRPARMVCEHEADDRYPVVSAASVLAKVRRDAIIAKIEKEFGEPIGSGYCHDPVTNAFLEKWIRENHELPPHTRRSWAPARLLLSLAKTSKLTEWCD
jgi:ribonuclease HII